MAKRTTKITAGMSMQQELFSNGMEEGALDIDLGLRQCLSRAMSGCGKDRYQIAAEMSRLMKATISKEMLDKYAASDPANGMRTSALTAFCFVTGTFEPFQYLLEPLGSDVLNPQDRDLIRLARLQEQKRLIEQEMQQIQSKRGLK
ncbi:MAG: hypothetical protein PHY09_18365 [Desulfuromonadaceae bacterium]|nr:hypothetical protein [Desulfuromonadaceae bacterium]